MELRELVLSIQEMQNKLEATRQSINQIRTDLFKNWDLRDLTTTRQPAWFERFFLGRKSIPYKLTLKSVIDSSHQSQIWWASQREKRQVVAWAKAVLQAYTIRCRELADNIASEQRQTFQKVRSELKKILVPPKPPIKIRRMYFIILFLVAAVLLIGWLVIRSQIEPGWEFDQMNSYATLNLNNSNHPFGLFKKNVRIGTVKIFNKVNAWYKLKGNFQVSLTVTANCPSYLVRTPNQALFFFEADGRKTPMIENMQVMQEVNIGIYLNLNAILDCNNLTMQEAEIPFSLATQAKAKGKDKLSDEKKSKVTLKLIPKSHRLGFKLEMDVESIEHRRLEKPVIEQLTIQNEVAPKYSTPLNCDMVKEIRYAPKNYRIG